MQELAQTGSRPLNRHDLLHVKAAECWLALGKLEEANREIESIRPHNKRHPEVRRISSSLAAATRYVQALIPDNRILEPNWDFEFDEVAA